MGGISTLEVEVFINRLPSLFVFIVGAIIENESCILEISFEERMKRSYLVLGHVNSGIEGSIGSGGRIVYHMREAVASQEHPGVNNMQQVC